jgi:hypothetical protein
MENEDAALVTSLCVDTWRCRPTSSGTGSKRNATGRGEGSPEPKRRRPCRPTPARSPRFRRSGILDSPGGHPSLTMSDLHKFRARYVLMGEIVTRSGLGWFEIGKRLGAAGIEPTDEMQLRKENVDDGCAGAQHRGFPRFRETPLRDEAVEHVLDRIFLKGDVRERTHVNQ